MTPPVPPLAPEALREALAREGLSLRPGEEAAVLATARYLRDAAERVRVALEGAS